MVTEIWQYYGLLTESYDELSAIEWNLWRSFCHRCSPFLFEKIKINLSSQLDVK